MDDDDKKPEDEPPEPARDAAQEEDTELREVSEEDLKQILAAHKTWIETYAEEGKQADLSRTDLQGARLSGVNLQGAWLIIAKLQGADLSDAMGLTWGQLRVACGNDETRLPDYLGDLTMQQCLEPTQSPSN